MKTKCEWKKHLTITAYCFAFGQLGFAFVSIGPVLIILSQQVNEELAHLRSLFLFSLPLSSSLFSLLFFSSLFSLFSLFSFSLLFFSLCYFHEMEQLHISWTLSCIFAWINNWRTSDTQNKRTLAVGFWPCFQWHRNGCNPICSSFVDTLHVYCCPRCCHGIP